MVRDNRTFAEKADEGTYLASGHRVRLSRAAGATHFSEAHGHPKAAKQYGFPFQYQSRPNWNTYASVLEFAGAVRRDLRGMHPRDLIDIQSFLWVQGSEEYD